MLEACSLGWRHWESMRSLRGRAWYKVPGEGKELIKCFLLPFLRELLGDPIYLASCLGM